jgi:thiol-disulfide isomerase/thioredoxin
MKIVLVLLLVMLVRSEVVLLEESTIEAFIAENPRVLVFFTAEWSKDCKKFLPSFQKLEKKVLKEKRDVKLAMIDSGNNTALEQKYKIVGYPTLKHFNEGVVSNFKPRKYIDLMLSELELFELPSHFVVDNKEKFAEI